MISKMAPRKRHVPKAVAPARAVQQRREGERKEKRGKESEGGHITTPAAALLRRTYIAVHRQHYSVTRRAFVHAYTTTHSHTQFIVRAQGWRRMHTIDI